MVSLPQSRPEQPHELERSTGCAFRLHPRHVRDGKLVGLAAAEAVELKQPSRRSSPVGSDSVARTASLCDGPSVTIQGSTLKVPAFSKGFEVNLLFSVVRPLVCNGESDCTTLLVAPACQDFLGGRVEDPQELTFELQVWVLQIVGSGPDLLQGGLDLLSAAGAIRSDFEDSLTVMPKSLGTGSNAVVFPASRKVQRLSKGGSLVVKMFKQPAVESSRLKQQTQLREEVNALVRAQGHPNVVGFNGVFIADDGAQQWALVMQACMGGSLFQSVLRTSYSELRARSCMQGLLSALEYLHVRCRMIHRDVKPENVLLGSDGRAVLADFGLATRLPADGQLERRCGTPGYLAPEMLQDTGYDAKADLFSAGATLFFVFCCRAPFNAGTIAQTLRQTVRGTLDLESDVRLKKVSPLCKDFMRSLMERKVDLRPSAEEATRSGWFDADIAESTAPAPEGVQTVGALPSMQPAGRKPINRLRRRSSSMGGDGGVSPHSSSDSSSDDSSTGAGSTSRKTSKTSKQKGFDGLMPGGSDDRSRKSRGSFDTLRSPLKGKIGRSLRGLPNLLRKLVRPPWKSNKSVAPAPEEASVWSLAAGGVEKDADRSTTYKVSSPRAPNRRKQRASSLCCEISLPNYEGESERTASMICQMRASKQAGSNTSISCQVDFPCTPLGQAMPLSAPLPHAHSDQSSTASSDAGADDSSREVLSMRCGQEARRSQGPRYPSAVPQKVRERVPTLAH
eukprot:CAMPEP_0195082368 /NCGR_PEP_ID=MMETSP0448-20130528/23567_1 /TAXON_ID=66468 /ORGANISM="Heterocapsa triquestra, Strain CCMP 448" /LENGTH=734 /DNA_ID=CAMNT_0040115475 /DNA_START=74 /DNA_END=2278 /DNA_ORIENTATION=-